MPRGSINFQPFSTAILQYYAMSQIPPFPVLGVYDNRGKAGSALLGDLDYARGPSGSPYQAIKSEVISAFGQPLDFTDRVTTNGLVTSQDRTVKEQKRRMRLALWLHLDLARISPATCHGSLMPQGPLRSQSIYAPRRDQTLIVRFDVGHVLTMFIYMDPAALEFVQIILPYLLLQPNLKVSMKSTRGKLDSIEEYNDNSGIRKLPIGSRCHTTLYQGFPFDPAAGTPCAASSTSQTSKNFIHHTPKLRNIPLQELVHLDNF